MNPEISVVIPNFNGEELLRKNLPPLLAALDTWGGSWEVIVVDDGSRDGSCALLREGFPTVRLVENAVNSGFSRSCNRGMAEARHSLVLCLNNDVLVSEGFLQPLIAHFIDPSVFAVTPNILAEREGKNQGVVFGGFGKGFIRGGFAALDERPASREILYAVGACVVYDLAKFSELGGYLEIYSPYLFEDVDLSYRAWKRGWRSLYEPAATVHHHSSATIGKTRKRDKRRVYFRNRFLFHWINLTDRRYLLRNLFHTTLRLAVSFAWLDISYYRSFFQALVRLRGALRERRSACGRVSLTDAEIIRRTGRNP